MLRRSIATAAVIVAVAGLLTTAPKVGAQTSRERFAPSAIEAKLDLSPEATKGMRIFIEEKFGRPDAPKSWDELPVDFGQRDLAAGKAAGWKLQTGSALFNQHCAACHGSSGDGAGPKAAKLEPQPRDFRRGWFKFRSTVADERGHPGRPLRHDLAETLRLGLPGTPMPAFEKLQPAETAALVEYVRWLAIRGEFETRLAQLLDGAAEVTDIEQILAGEYKDDLRRIVESWLVAERESFIARPPKRLEPNAASLAAGKKLFTDKISQCYKCHGPDGKGLPKEQFPEIWKGLSPVWDLTSSLYRGGIDPDDVFRRLRHGMIGSAMPQYLENSLTDDDAWHVVNYTLSIASPALRDKQVVRRPPPKGQADDSPLVVRAEPTPPPAPQINWKGWATLRGRFVYQGQPPVVPAVPIVRDRAICGDKYESESFLIDKEGGLANVVISLRTKKTPWKEVIEPRQDPAVLDIFKCRVVPHVLAVLAGEEFIVKNSDPIGHNVQATLKYNGGFNRTLAANTKASFKLSRAEDRPVPVASAIHPHMQGYLLACENPYFAVTDKGGRFQIAKLPAGGPLEFQVWHERVPKGLTVKDVKLGRLTIQLGADETTDLGDMVITPEMVR